MKRFLLLLLCLSATAGCEAIADQDAPADALPGDRVVTDAVTLPMAFSAPGVTSGRTPRGSVAPDSLFVRALSLFSTLGPLAEPASVPTAPDLVAYHAFLRANEADPAHHLLEQMVASALLLRVLPSGGAESYLDAEPASRTPDARAAASLAAQLLVKNENPSVDLISQAIALGGDAWTPEARLDARTRSVAAARAWSTTPCATCDPDAAVPSGKQSMRANLLESAERVESAVRETQATDS